VRTPFRTLALAGLVLLPAILAPAAQAAAPATPYVRYGLSADNVPVLGLPGAMASPRASLIVPRAWKVLSRAPARITLLTDKPGCPYRVTFRARWKAGPDESATDHVTAALPASMPAYVEDWGVRRAYAWRVVRGSGSQRIDGLQAVGSRPSYYLRWLQPGQAVWRELAASAPKARPDARCHAGFYREVARQIGDALADNTRTTD
jgi:hypothetical protein